MPRPVPNDITPEAISRLVNRPSPVLLEIGAHNGSDTARMLAAMPGATIHCFEPDPRPRQQLVKRFGRDSRVFIHAVAVGAASGKAIFNQSAGSFGGYPLDWDYSGSLRAPKKHLKKHPEIKFDSKIEVDVVRLDDWASDHGVSEVDFIWMDTQGAEVDIIAGGRETFAQTRFVYTEYSNDELYEGQITLVEILRRLPDFRILTRYPEDVLLENSKL